MRLEVDEENDKSIIHVNGRIDATTAPQLENQLNTLLDGNQIRLIVDFNNVDYLSSAGMRVLLAMTKRVQTLQGGMIVLHSLHDDVMEIIRMAGFEQILKIAPGEKEAREHF